MTALPTDVRAEFIDHALSDTGFFARRILGFDYDQDPLDSEKIYNIGTGGIRDNGPHQQMTEFIDNAGPGIHHMEAPRGTYKSYRFIAFMERRAIRNRNIRILYVRETLAEAQKVLQMMQEHLVANEKLISLFGDLKGKRWSGTGKFMDIAGKTDHSSEYTFTAGGVDVSMTGMHPHLIIADDLVTWNNVRTEEGREKTKACIKMLVPLLMSGGTMIIVGTRYAGGDAYDHLINNIKLASEPLILEAGVELEEDEDEGIIRVVGKPIFDHLTLPFLQRRLGEMEPADFCSQYLNRIISGAVQPFTREQFKVCDLDGETISMLSGYILTDAATSEDDGNCYSVIAVVGMDATDTAYVLDMSVGHWTPGRFVDEFFNLIARWGGRIAIHSQLFEATTMDEVYISYIEEESRRRGVRLNIEKIKRSGAENKKKDRILRLQGRFKSGRIYFNRTIPTTFADLSRTRNLLSIPHSPLNDGSVRVEGELVEEFINFPRHTRNDIPDALADIDSVEKSSGIRYCRYIPGSVRRFRSDVGSAPRYRPGQTVNPHSRRTPAGGHWSDRVVEHKSWMDRVPRR